MSAEERAALKAAAVATAQKPMLCGLCLPDAPPATVRIVFEHGPRGCWCERVPGGAHPRRHVCGACEEHTAREVNELEHLGYRVLLVENLWRVNAGDG